MGHGQSYCSRNTIAIAIQLTEVVHLLRLQVREHPLEKIEEDCSGNTVFGQNSRKPGPKRFPWRRKRSSSCEPTPPGIQFYADILNATSLGWYIHQVIQR